MAYELFDGKYTMRELQEMPYKDLIMNIEREQKFQRDVSAKRGKQDKNFG